MRCRSSSSGLRSGWGHLVPPDLQGIHRDAGSADLLLKIRRHGNFIEWVPFVLLLMILAEAQGAGRLWLQAAGALLLIGRIAHPFGLKIDNPGHPLRYVGNGTNILAVAILFIALARIVTGL